MRRTALVVAMLLAVAATFLYLLGSRSVFIFSGALVALTVLLWLLRRHVGLDLKSTLVLLSAALISVSFVFHGIRKDKTVDLLASKRATVECVVMEEPNRFDTYSEFEVRISGNRDGVKIPENVKFSLKIQNTAAASSAEVGDIILADVRFQTIKNESAKNYYYRGMYLSAWCGSAEIIGHKTSVYEAFVAVRKYVRGTLNKYLSGDSSALMNGLLLGDKTQFSDELYYDFKACGLSHIVAISGLHINIISLTLYALLSKFAGKRKAAGFMFIPLGFIVAVTGFTPSAIRAGIMFCVFLLGKILLKNSDALNSLGVAIAAMLAVNPYYIASISFQLSCAATAGIIIAGPFADEVAKKVSKRINRKLPKRVVRSAVSLSVLSVAANLLTLPFTALHFGFVSVVSPIVSVLVTPAATYLLMLGVTAVALSVIPFIGCYLAATLLFLADILTDYVAVIAKLGAGIPFSYVLVDYQIIYLCVGGILCFTALWLLLGRIGGKRTVALASAALLVAGITANTLSGLHSVVLTVPNTETPCAIFVKDGKCAVLGLDYGNEEAVLNHLKINNVTRVQTIVVTDGDYDAANSVSGKYRTETVMWDVQVPTGQTEILDGVVLTVSDDGFKINCLDREIIFIKAETVDDVLKLDCDLCVVEFDGGNRRAVIDGEVLGSTDSGWSVKLRNGKDMIFNGD